MSITSSNGHEPVVLASAASHLVQEISFGDFGTDELNVYLNKPNNSAGAAVNEHELRLRLLNQQQRASQHGATASSSIASPPSSVLTSPSSIASSTSDLSNHCAKAAAQSAAAAATNGHRYANGVKFSKHLDLKQQQQPISHCSATSSTASADADSDENGGGGLEFGAIEFGGFDLTSKLPGASTASGGGLIIHDGHRLGKEKRTQTSSSSKHFAAAAVISIAGSRTKSSSSSSTSSSFSSSTSAASNPLASPPICSYSSDYEPSESQQQQRMQQQQFSIDCKINPHKQRDHPATKTLPHTIAVGPHDNNNSNKNSIRILPSQMQAVSAPPPPSSKDGSGTNMPTAAPGGSRAISYSSAVASSISNRGQQHETISLTQSETVIHTIKLNNHALAMNSKKKPVQQTNGGQDKMAEPSLNSKSSNSSSSSSSSNEQPGNSSSSSLSKNNDSNNSNSDSQRRNKKRKPPNYYQNNPEIAAIIKLSDEPSPSTTQHSSANTSTSSDTASNLSSYHHQQKAAADVTQSHEPVRQVTESLIRTTTQSKTTTNNETKTSSSNATPHSVVTKPPVSTASQPISWAAVANSSSQQSSQPKTAPVAPPVGAKPATESASQVPVITGQIEKLTIKPVEAASQSAADSTSTTTTPTSTTHPVPTTNTTTTTSSANNASTTTTSSTQPAPSAWAASSGPKAWSSLFGSAKAGGGSSSNGTSSNETPVNVNVAQPNPASSSSQTQTGSSHSKAPSKAATPKLISPPPPPVSSAPNPTNGPVSSSSTSSSASSHHDQPQAGSGDILKLLGSAFKQCELKHSAPALQPRGLRNKQNWCYVNATLQALLACPPFYNLMKSVFAKIKSSNVSTKSVPCLTSLGRYVNEFKTIWRPAHESGKAASFNGREITIGDPFEIDYFYEMLVGLRASTETFKTGRQEDAQEFLSLLLNRLHEEMVNCLESLNPTATSAQQQQPASAVGDHGKLNGSSNSFGIYSLAQAAADEAAAATEDSDDWKEVGKKNRAYITRKAEFKQSPLSDIFCGQFRSTLSQHGSKDKESISLEPFFTLPLDIQPDSIRNLNEALEHLVKKEELFGFTSQETKQEIEAFKQISFEDLPPVLILYLKCFVYDKHGGIQKLNKRIDFNIDLEISKELISANQRSKLREKKRAYKLFAVEYHLGDNASGGHYITDVYHPGIIAWVRFDDASVKIIPTNQVLKTDDKKLIPYLLYYRRADLISSSS